MKDESSIRALFILHPSAFILAKHPSAFILAKHPSAFILAKHPSAFILSAETSRPRARVGSVDEVDL